MGFTLGVVSKQKWNISAKIQYRASLLLTLLEGCLFITLKNLFGMLAKILRMFPVSWSYCIQHTWLWVLEIPQRKTRSAMKRQMLRWRWMLVRVPWMERQNWKVRIQRNKQTRDSAKPTRVINTKSNDSWRRGRKKSRRMNNWISSLFNRKSDSKMYLHRIESH